MSDVVTASAPLHRDEEQVWGDTAYQGAGEREETRGVEVSSQITKKADTRRGPDEAGAHEAAERRNTPVRAKLEHQFLSGKSCFSYVKVH